MMAGQSRAQEITEENLEQWIEASSQGNLEASYKLGCYYYDTALEFVDMFLQFEMGYDGLIELDDLDELVEINENVWFYLLTEHTKAAIYWKGAAEKGHAESQYRMGEYAYSDFKIGDAAHATAANWFRKAAEQGHREAQYRLADCYYDGKGVTPDYAEAARWYRKAFEQGHALSLYRIGLCYYKAQNYTEAAKWYSKAAERGNIEAQYRLGLCYYGDKNYAEAVKWWRKASEQGHAEAQYHLGLCYYDGRGVAQDYSAAIRWWSKTRSVEARYCLGLCYYHGHGVTQDDYAAMKMWRSAATQGYGEAQYQLGMWYKNRRRYAEAASWWRMAAEQGHEEAKTALVTMYMKGEISTPPSIPTGTNADAAKDASAAEDKATESQTEKEEVSQEPAQDTAQVEEVAEDPATEEEAVEESPAAEEATEKAESAEEAQTEESPTEESQAETETAVKDDAPTETSETPKENTRPNPSPLVGTSSGETYALFFPAHGVLPGKTTVADVEAMGYPVDRYESGDASTKIDGIRFEDEDGDGIFDEGDISRHVRFGTGIYTGMIPEQWQQLGFNWRLSYKEWLTLFKKMGFTIKHRSKPRTYKARGGVRGLVAEFDAVAPDRSFKMSLFFHSGREDYTYSDGYSTHSKRTLAKLSFELLNPPAVYPANPVEVAPSVPTAHRYFSDFFPVYGVTLGETSVAEMKPLAGYVKDIYGVNSAELNTLIFEDLDKDRVYEWIRVGDMIPEKWQQLGLDWRLSYDEWLALFEKMGFTIEHLEYPVTEEFFGRNALSAKFVATAPDQSFTMLMEFEYGNEHGEGCTTSSKNSLIRITIEKK